MRRSPLVMLLALALAAPALARPPKPAARRGAAPAEPKPTHRIVGGTVDLSPKVGAKMAAQLLAGTPVRVVKPEGPDFVRVETLGSVRMSGVVRVQAVGLRVTKRVDLQPGAGARPVRLAVGTDVRVVALRGAQALVETVGVVVKGTCPRAALGVAGPDFVYPEPEGPLFRVKRAVVLADPLAPERVIARIDTGEEVVGLLEDGPRARVRTYGPVALEGVVPRDALGGREKKEVSLDPGNASDYEVSIDADLLEKEGGRVVGRVRGGTPAVLEEDAGEFARIVTAGDVRTRGVVSKRALTRLTPVDESTK
ncbi:MAG: hypothetical protein HY906_05905 [Deltaproteobacteria bacterium]|nr:hypothetical protein [Deltaproteobacteria bacterium]